MGTNQITPNRNRDAAILLNTRFKEFSFGPNQTIRSVILLLNNHALSGTELNRMMEAYNVLNNHQVPRLGSTVKIPVTSVVAAKRQARRKPPKSQRDIRLPFKYYCKATK